MRILGDIKRNLIPVAALEEAEKSQLSPEQLEVLNYAQGLVSSLPMTQWPREVGEKGYKFEATGNGKKISLSRQNAFQEAANLVISEGDRAVLIMKDSEIAAHMLNVLGGRFELESVKLPS